MSYDDYIDIGRWVFRFGFLSVAVALWVFVNIVDIPIIKNWFYKVGLYFLSWFVGSMIVLQVDYRYPTGLFVFSLMFNTIMVYGLAVGTLKKAWDLRKYQKAPLSDRPSDALADLLYDWKQRKLIQR